MPVRFRPSAWIRATCFAKVNLFLNIAGKRADGYHDIQSVFQTIALFDTLEISISDTFRLTVEGSAPGMRPDELREGNILEKIYGFFRERYELPAIRVRLVKNIPVGAGLGGGSSDGAGLIVSLNRLFSLGLGAEELREIGARFGSDVPFFIEGGTARVGGRGEEVLRMAGHEAAKLFFVLIYPGVSVSTALAYRECVSFGSGDKFPDFLKLIESAEESAGSEWTLKLSRLSTNGFEEKVKARVPEVKAALEALKLHSPYALLSGSGSTVFAVFAKEDEARKAHRAVLAKFPSSYLAGSVGEGIRLEMMEDDGRIGE